MRVLMAHNHFLRGGGHCQLRIVKNSDPFTLSYGPISNDYMNISCGIKSKDVCLRLKCVV